MEQNKYKSKNAQIDVDDTPQDNPSNNSTPEEEKKKNDKPYSKTKKWGILIVCASFDLFIFIFALLKALGTLAIELVTTVLSFSIIAAPLTFILKNFIVTTFNLTVLVLELSVTIIFFMVLILFILTTSSNLKKTKLICKTLYRGGFVELIPIISILPIWTLSAIRILKNKDI